MRESAQIPVMENTWNPLLYWFTEGGIDRLIWPMLLEGETIIDVTPDLFHESIPDEVIAKIFAVMALSPPHKFRLQTDYAKRMDQYLNKDGLPEHISQLMLDYADCLPKPWNYKNMKREIICYDPVAEWPPSHVDIICTSPPFKGEIK